MADAITASIAPFTVSDECASYAEVGEAGECSGNPLGIRIPATPAQAAAVRAPWASRPPLTGLRFPTLWLLIHGRIRQ